MKKYLIYPLNGLPRDDLQLNPNPGSALANHFEEKFGLQLLDCSMKTSGIFYELIKIFKIFSSEKPEIFFYNFPKQYWLVYFVYIFIVKRAPGLILADGVNVFFPKYKFTKLISIFFSKIISLSEVKNDKQFIWYPGIIRKIDLDKPKKHVKPYFVYNSKPFKYNGIDEFVDIINQNIEIDFCITAAAAAHIEAVIGKKGNVITFENLIYSEYIEKVRKSDGVILIRNNNYFENNFNFPSKLLEALSIGSEVYSKYKIFSLPIDRTEFIGCQKFYVYSENTLTYLLKQNFDENLKKFLN